MVDIEIPFEKVYRDISEIQGRLTLSEASLAQLEELAKIPGLDTEEGRRTRQRLETDIAINRGYIKAMTEELERLTQWLQHIDRTMRGGQGRPPLAPGLPVPSFPQRTSPGHDI